MLVKLGRWSFQRRWWAVGLWVLSLITVMLVARAANGTFEGNPSSPESDSSTGFDIIKEQFPDFGSGYTGTVVFQAEQGVDDPEIKAAMTELFEAIDTMEGLSTISPYAPLGARQIATDGELAGQLAFATINVDRDVDQEITGPMGTEILERAPQIDGLTVEVGGAILAEFHPPESELIGLAFAIVVLILAFGSVLAMGLPIGVAVMGVGVGTGIITLLSSFMSMPSFATVLGAMIGLGVGIDYALFIVTRYREGLHVGLDSEQATTVALDTSGRAVIFAGLTVVVSLLGMLVMGLPFVSGLGIAAASTVLVTMLASITLLPAFLGFAGERIERTRVKGLVASALTAGALLTIGLNLDPRIAAGLAIAAVAVVSLGFAVPGLKAEVPSRKQKPLDQTLWYRWSRVIQRRPLAAAAIGTTILLVLSIPVLSLRLGFSDEGNFSEETTTRRAYDMLAEGFGPGFNGPLILATEISGPQDLATLNALSATIGQLDLVAEVSPPLPNDLTSPTAAIIQVVPTGGPQDESTQDLVTVLRDDVIPAAVAGTDVTPFVTGSTAASIDFTEYLSARLLVFFGVVLALSFFLLMAVFRSLLVPVKAVIMNMLSISAAYGLAVAIFQWGWGASIFGLAGGAPIEPFIPMMLFAIVFGLSMDYEVFLLSRIKEDFDKTGDPVESVANGLAATAQVITAAAAIMVVVFGSFMFEDDRIIKLFGFGLASAVFLDATLVRMLLVPATMELLGARNWWLPAWLDRILPKIDVEGHAVEADEPGPPTAEPERELVDA